MASGPPQPTSLRELCEIAVPSASFVVRLALGVLLTLSFGNQLRYVSCVFIKSLLSVRHECGISDEEMEFKEIEGDRAKSKLLETSDHHIYRRNKANSPYLSCYFSLLTKPMLKTSPNAEKCDGKIIISY